MLRPPLRIRISKQLLQLRSRLTHTLTSPPPHPPPPSLLLTLFTRPVHAYGRSQRAHPWATQIATGITINILSDINAQHLFPPSTSHVYDPLRTLRMVVTSATLAIPVNEWYTRISTVFTSRPKAHAVALRVVLSNIVFAPVYLVAFFGVQALLEGGGSDGVKEKVGRVPRAWRDGLILWPAVGFVNFWWVPIEFRALVGGGASLGWGTWLSYLNSRPKVEVGVAEEVVGVEPGVLKTAAAAVGMNQVAVQAA